jgi:hypothetical protein
MDFNTLHETIPYAKGGKEKVLRYSPYPNIMLAMPGRHALDTVPIGGDFVVMVSDPIYPIADHQFTHTDIFKDIELKSKDHSTEQLMRDYLSVVHLNTDADNHQGWEHMPGMVNITFLYATQCLAVAEHRRYAKYEAKFGGRYLPFRFAAGIAEGLWTAADAANLQRKGRPGVEMLEKLNGVPVLTKELMS